MNEEKSFFITHTGYFEQGSLAIQEGDMVCFLPGCIVPLLIRKRDYCPVLVSECFIWALMDGEAMENGEFNQAYELFNLK